MQIVKIQFAPWDKVYNFQPNGLELSVGDKVVVKTELGVELGDVIGFEEIRELAEGEPEICPVLRLATRKDLAKVIEEEEKEKALDVCRKMTEKHGLQMKLIDVNFSFDGSRITFAFIANGRIDFREMVKDLTKHFNRSIRLQQIGIRDEAKICGDCGHCGRPLCCGKFLKDLASVTSGMAELQQVSHRGSERISGVCGRLMCCLCFEQPGYEALAKKLPPIASPVKVDGQPGRVVGWNILKQTVKVELAANGEGNTTIEVGLDKIRLA